MWLATIVFQRVGLIDLNRWLGLHFWQGSHFNVGQLISYMFMHDTSNVTGPATSSVNDIIEAINSGHAAFTMDDFYNSLLTVGASGAVFGLLVAFGMLFPNLPMYIIPFPFPIKAKWMVIGYGVLELFLGVSHVSPGVAHYAHLGGMIAGVILILYWKHNGTLTRGGNGFY
jgi:membrane associated rhomboid family serine protease